MKKITEAIVDEKLSSEGYVYLSPSEYFMPADFGKFVRQFSKEMKQYDGQKSFIVQPSKNYLSVYHANSAAPLYPHTEAYEYDVPPRYVFLNCITPDRNSGGESYICDMRPFIDSLGPEDLIKLRKNKYYFLSNEGLRKQGIYNSTASPFLTELDDEMCFRFSYNNIVFFDNDFFGRRIRESVMEYFEENRVVINLKLNDILVFDNYRMIHGRSAIYDLNRQIRRMWGNKKEL